MTSVIKYWNDNGEKKIDKIEILYECREAIPPLIDCSKLNIEEEMSRMAKNENNVTEISIWLLLLNDKYPTLRSFIIVIHCAGEMEMMIFFISTQLIYAIKGEWKNVTILLQICFGMTNKRYSVTCLALLGIEIQKELENVAFFWWYDDSIQK